MAQQKQYDEIIGRQPRAVWLILSTLGMIALVVGTMMPILHGNTTPYQLMSPTFKYIFSAGAVLLFVSRMFSPYTGSVARVRRLYRIETWSAIFFLVAGFFLFYEPETTRDWLAFTLAGGAIQIYTSIMIPRAIKKALKEQQ
jgi:hypothetical protein